LKGRRITLLSARLGSRRLRGSEAPFKGMRVLLVPGDNERVPGVLTFYH